MTLRQTWYEKTFKPEAQVEDMISIVLKFTPQHGVTQDSIKLASNSAKALDECELAASVAVAFSDVFNVDAYLAECPEIFEEMVTASSNILSEVGYDVTNIETLLLVSLPKISCGDSI